MKVYILINAEAGKIWKIAETALEIKFVDMAHAVTGQFDVIIYAELADISDLGELIDRLHSIEGVQKTQTAVVMPTRVVMEDSLTRE
jgi:DNA-binding Lrp family transcriptional regulator